METLRSVKSSPEGSPEENKEVGAKEIRSDVKSAGFSLGPKRCALLQSK